MGRGQTCILDVSGFLFMLPASKVPGNLHRFLVLIRTAALHSIISRPAAF